MAPHGRGEAVRMTAKWLAFGAGVALLCSWLAVACESSGGGSSCFSPVHGPSDTSCEGFDLNLVCPVDLSPWYACTCTAVDPSDAGGDGGSTSQIWICAPA